MSVQLASYLQARANGTEWNVAAIMAGISIAEARLTEQAIARGELRLPLPNPAAGKAAQAEGGPVMARKTKPGDGVTNLSETKDIIRNAVPKIVNLKERRKTINAEIAEVREQVNAAGVPKKALDHAIRVKEMDPEDRQRFDEGYAIARDAIGLRMSGSLFDMIETPTTADQPANDETADAAA